MVKKHEKSLAPKEVWIPSRKRCYERRGTRLRHAHEISRQNARLHVPSVAVQCLVIRGDRFLKTRHYHPIC
jgi:hypothetical protein